jgi:hypothetical protein
LVELEIAGVNKEDVDNNDDENDDEEEGDVPMCGRIRDVSLIGCREADDNDGCIVDVPVEGKFIPLLPIFFCDVVLCV